MTDKERFIERQTKNIKAHSWYVDYPIEKCRQMAEYLWNQFNSMKEPREITTSTYEISRKRIKKDIENFLR